MKWLSPTRLIPLALACALLAWIAARLSEDLGEQGRRGPRAAPPAPVRVAPIERGPLRLERRLSGDLRAHARRRISAEVAGRVERLHVDIGDPIRLRQPLVDLDDEAAALALKAARAGWAVAKARRGAARAADALAAARLERAARLHKRGVTSTEDRDAAEAERRAAAAALDVAQAEVQRARAAREAATLGVRRAHLEARWAPEEGAAWVVAARHVEAGDHVRVDDPLLTLIALDPLEAVLFISERDYPDLRPGAPATLHAAAYPGVAFPAEVARVAPAFEAASRRARVELRVPNPDGRLKPGMFIRADVLLRQIDGAVTVPEEALTTRAGVEGLFTVAEGAAVTHWRPARVGARGSTRVEILGLEPRGAVVILGHQLLSDGAAVSIDGAAP